jgi:hypothetical protein
VHLGPITWRVFWARVGNGLYLTNKVIVLDDLQEASARAEPAKDRGPLGHAMVRLRPQNWKQVLPDYHLSWSENDRDACLNNIGPLSSMARSLAATMTAADDRRFEESLHELAHRIYGVRFRCPQGGRYELDKDRLGVHCSLHGTALAPTQPAFESTDGMSPRPLRQFGGLTISLTFEQDGLHAIAVLERKMPVRNPR